MEVFEFFGRLRNRIAPSERRRLRPEIVELIQRMIDQKVVAEFDRRGQIEDALWARHFADAAYANPKEQRDAIIRHASARATLSILNRR